MEAFVSSVLQKLKCLWCLLIIIIEISRQDDHSFTGEIKEGGQFRARKTRRKFATRIITFSFFALKSSKIHSYTHTPTWMCVCVHFKCYFRTISAWIALRLAWLLFILTLLISSLSISLDVAKLHLFSSLHLPLTQKWKSDHTQWDFPIFADWCFGVSSVAFSTLSPGLVLCHLFQLAGNVCGCQKQLAWVVWGTHSKARPTVNCIFPQSY